MALAVGDPQVVGAEAQPAGGPSACHLVRRGRADGLGQVDRDRVAAGPGADPATGLGDRAAAPAGLARAGAARP